MKTFTIAAVAVLLLGGVVQATYPPAFVVRPVQQLRVEYIVQQPQLVRETRTIERVEYQSAPQIVERSERVVERVQGGYQSSQQILLLQQRQQHYAPPQRQQARGHHVPLAVVQPPQRVIQQTETKRGLLGRIRQQTTTTVIE